MRVRTRAGALLAAAACLLGIACSSDGSPAVTSGPPGSTEAPATSTSDASATSITAPVTSTTAAAPSTTGAPDTSSGREPVDQVLPAPGYGYLELPDGTTLSINVLFPDRAQDGPFPTVVEYSGYDPSNPKASLLGRVFNALGYAYVGVNLRGTGCSGRRAIVETVRFDESLRELVAQRAPLSQVRAAARAQGARSLRTAALDLLAQGLTTRAEVDRVTMAEEVQA